MMTENSSHIDDATELLNPVQQQVSLLDGGLYRQVGRERNRKWEGGRERKWEGTHRRGENIYTQAETKPTLLPETCKRAQKWRVSSSKNFL